MSENEVCSDALLVRCYFEATETDCAIDNQVIFLLFKGVI